MTTKPTVPTKPCGYCGGRLRRGINHSQAWTPRDYYNQTGGLVGASEAMKGGKVPEFQDIVYYACEACGFRYTAEEAENATSPHRSP